MGGRFPASDEQSQGQRDKRQHRGYHDGPGGQFCVRIQLTGQHIDGRGRRQRKKIMPEVKAGPVT